MIVKNTCLFFRRGFTGLVLLSCLLTIAAGPTHAAAKSSGSDTSTKQVLNKNDRYKNLELFQKVLQFVEKNYVDEVKNDDLTLGAIKGMLETLDPHSNFLTPELYRDVKIDTSGKFGGVGLEVAVKDDVLTVLASMEDSPASKAGITPGDKIVKINGESTKGFSLAEAVARMRGSDGTSVKLTLYRKGWSGFKEIELKRQTIKVRTVRSEMIEPAFGYIRLSQFNEHAAKDVKAAMESLDKKTKLKGLVFDLRSNPGGLLDQAVDVSSLFIDEGIIVTTEGRDPALKDVRYAKKGMARKDLPLVILINSSTASAAEIVAAALQEHGRAMILGETSFGKGSVQTVIDLGNDLGLKLTIARYYSPKGVSIQEKGVVPDVVLDEYDPKLLAQARIKREATREKDLKRHLVNDQAAKQSRDEFTVQEFKEKMKSGSSVDDPEMKPLSFDPKEDDQVTQAVKALKSFEVFKRLKAQ